MELKKAGRTGWLPRRVPPAHPLVKGHIPWLQPPRKAEGKSPRLTA